MKQLIAKTVFCISTFYSISFFSQTDKTVVAFTKSIEQEKKQDYTSAIESILELNDSSAYEINARLGWLYYKAGSKRKSIHYYERAINIMPNAIEPSYGFGFPAYLLEDYQSIVNQDKKILEIDPNNKTINGNLGSLYYYNKDYKNAITYLEKVINLYPFDYDNNLLLGWANLRLGKNAEAESYFNTVLMYSPKDASANEGLTAIKTSVTKNEKLLFNLTKSYELAEKSDYKGAIAILKEVYDKTSYVINLRLGWLSYLAGQQVESLGYYKIANELKPNAIEPKLGITYPLAALGNKNDLKATYESVLAIDPNNTYVHYNIGLLDYEKKDYQSALNRFEKIVKLYPCDTNGLLMLAWSNYYLGKTTEARALYNKVLCLSPNNASALLGMGLQPIDQIKKKTGF